MGLEYNYTKGAQNLQNCRVTKKRRVFWAKTRFSLKTWFLLCIRFSLAPSFPLRPYEERSAIILQHPSSSGGACSPTSHARLHPGHGVRTITILSGTGPGQWWHTGAPNPKARCYVRQIQGHIVQQNLSWRRHPFTNKSASVSNELGFFICFPSRPANSRRTRCTGRETTALNPYIFYGFLRVKDGFPTGKIRVPKMKVLKRSKKNTGFYG